MCFMPCIDYMKIPVDDWARWADLVDDPVQRQAIRQRYHELYRPTPTPLTHPEMFDPLDPPPGYRYDHLYDWWLVVAPTK